MSSTQFSAYPQNIAQGVQDNSAAPTATATIDVPQHLPHLHIIAERGLDTPQYMVGTLRSAMYGVKSFDYTYPYANHATVFSDIFNKAGNLQLLQRLIPDDAAKALLRFSLEVCPDVTMPKYQRNALTGAYDTDASGNYIQALDPNTQQPLTVQGVAYIWHVNYAGTSNQAFGQAQSVQAMYPRSNGAQSQVFPMWDYEVSSAGIFGDNMGVRMIAPTTKSAKPLNTTLFNALKLYPYRFQFVELVENQSTPNTLETINGSTSSDLVLTPGKFDPVARTRVSLPDTLVKSYQNLRLSKGPIVPGPFGRMYQYTDNISIVLELLFGSEATAMQGKTTSNTPWLPMDYTDGTNIGMMNILNGLDQNGVPYESVRAGTVSDTDAVVFDPTYPSAFYATGGADGDISLSNFDAMVKNQFLNYGQLQDANGNPINLLDNAAFQQSAYWDSGFSPDTKRAMASVVGLRKDVEVHLATHYSGAWILQNVGNGNQQTQELVWVPNTTQLDVSTEDSIGIGLASYARLSFPESEEFGTTCFRVSVRKGSGYWPDIEDLGYYDLLPGTVEDARAWANYMGASNGIWKAGFSPDEDPNNRTQYLEGVINVYANAATRNAEWNGGLTYFESDDVNGLFTPALRTVYDDSTSVLASQINASAIVTLEKYAQRVWRSMVGNTRYTQAKFIEVSNQKFADLIKGKFDGRFLITAETKFTKDDSIRGFSWSLVIRIGCNVMKTTQVVTIQAYRQEALAALIAANNG